MVLKKHRVRSSPSHCTTLKPSNKVCFWQRLARIRAIASFFGFFLASGLTLADRVAWSEVVVHEAIGDSDSGSFERVLILDRKTKFSQGFFLLRQFGATLLLVLCIKVHCWETKEYCLVEIRFASFTDSVFADLGVLISHLSQWGPLGWTFWILVKFLNFYNIVFVSLFVFWWWFWESVIAGLRVHFFFKFNQSSLKNTL